MANFRYTALDPGGKSIRGRMDAHSAAAVADRLHGQGCFLLDASEVGRSGGLLDLLHADLSLRRGLPKSVIAHFTRELSVMLGAGQDIDHAMRFLMESGEDRHMRKLAANLRDQVRGGKSLAAAMGAHQNVFSRLYINLVRAGEAGGNLAETLEHLAELLERESKLAATIQSALVYPALLVVMAIATVAMLLTYVLPQFQPIFAQAGAKLPSATRALIGVGSVVRTDGGWMLGATLCLLLLGVRMLREPPLRMTAERIVLHLPLVGLLVRRAQAARLVRTLGTLVGNGVGLVSALSIVREVLGNLTATKAVDQAATEVKAGRKLAASLAAAGFFPSQTIHLLQLGEENGRLAEMALRAAAIHENQVNQSVQRLVSLLVPVITIVMGLVVAGIIGSLLVAMLSLSDLAI